MVQDQAVEQGRKFFPVSPLLLFPRTSGYFTVWLRQDGEYVLYAGRSEMFTPEHKARLHEMGVREVYVEEDHRKRFDRYVEENLGVILASEDLPVAERAGIFYDASLSIVKNLFRTGLPRSLSGEQMREVITLVRQTVGFLTRKDTLKSIGSLISHNYRVYHHSVNVFVYVAALLKAYDVSEKLLVECGVGALLHDIGKLRVPAEILEKPIGMSKSEQAVYQTHPVQGVAMCANLSVSSEVTNSILLHHERLDGTGYPAGICGADVPFLVRVLAVADRYESLVAGRTWREPMSSFQALRTISERDKGCYDLDVVTRFVQVLAGMSATGAAPAAASLAKPTR
jgi:putative nucleotidyltransferase with HDIG domain